MLNGNQILVQLNKLNENIDADQQWVIKNHRLVKSFKFKNFVEALAWMNKVAIYAEKVNHHPDWCNSYNKVQIQLITHDVNSITKLDFELAGNMQKEYSYS